jgi:hypothetical protein
MPLICEGEIMKTASIFKLMTAGLVIILFLVIPVPGQSQKNGEEATSKAFSQEQLAQMLAPIALYPDALLSQVLMASTYPLEVIEADRWVKKNERLKDDSLDDSLVNKDWDPSVKSLCHFPSVLGLMSEKITETTSLGNAFLAQEDEVMDTIQKLRTKAYEQGNLTSTSKQKVIEKEKTIVIEPANPDVVYVPYYNPNYVYGSWWYPAYPPYYWGPMPVIAGGGISFWSGPFVSFSLVSWSYFNWHRRSIYINTHKRPRYFRRYKWQPKPGHWYHSPKHRRGVAYRDKYTARKYGQSSSRSKTFRRDIRGFPKRQGTAGIIRKSRPRNIPPRAVSHRDNITRDQKKVIKIEPGRATPARVKRQKQVREEKVEKGGRIIRRERKADRRQDNIFGNIGDGKKERSSSRRGRFSREGPNRNPSDHNDRGRRNR